jgi:hypothetical protein
VDRPRAALPIVLGVLDPAARRVAVEPIGDLVVAEEGGGGLLFGEACFRGQRGRRSDEEDRCDKQQPADYARRRKLQSLLPTKFSGMTRMIAIA